MLEPVARNLVAVALLAFVATSASGGSLSIPTPNVGPPLLLRLEGIREPTRAAARQVGFTAVSYGFVGDGLRLWLAVNDARTVGGDQPINGKDVLEAASPYTPSFLVAGDPGLVGALRGSAIGAPLVIEGLVIRGSRTYLLRHVQVGDPAGR